MTAVDDDLFADPVAAAPGRDPEDEDTYTLPDPITGQVRRFPRVTKAVKHSGNTIQLDKWHDRHTGVGVAQNEDIQINLAQYDPSNPEHYDKIDKWVRIAQERVATQRKAHTGTGVHLVTERQDTGQPFVAKDWLKRDLAAYNAVIEAAGFRIIPQLREVRLCIKKDEKGHQIGEFGLVGTMDSALLHEDGVLYPADLKTGASLEWAISEAKAQVATYGVGLRCGWVWIKAPELEHKGYWVLSWDRLRQLLTDGHLPGLLSASAVSKDYGYILSLVPKSGVARMIRIDISDRMDFTDMKNPTVGGWALALDADRRRRTDNVHKRKSPAGWDVVATADMTTGEVTTA
jgi:hypothetical protein